ncbi:AAA family ATPase [Marinobacter nauticus]|uniref:AAA family ATPase n=1 Tax=Marinobacter nauticus TaxID=2743 RepID=UPI001C993D74|nr:response regulator receiver-like protein [Marinobacter nauticus]MBY5961307.1 response regulator receiver-like protein [Marinobacter nauticus]
MNDVIICVADEVGVRVWLERVLEAEWNLEFVSSSDLSRISRLVNATGAGVVIVAIDDDESRALKVFNAVQKACPETHLIGVSQRISQDLLLNIMRAGARDCLITGIDSDSARERVRKVADVAHSTTSVSRGKGSRGKLVLLTSPSPVVDARFFAQNFVWALSENDSSKSILALDTNAESNRTFYFDNLNRLTLNEVVSRGDSVDKAFIDTALEEFSPGLRLLSGRLSKESLEGDLGADLYIAITQLASLFDYVVVRIDSASVDGWLKAMGAEISDIVLVTQPTVDQLQASDILLKGCSEWVPDQCRLFVAIDGYERKSSLTMADVQKTLGRSGDLVLPMEWRYRLEAINAGIPMSLVPARNQYEKHMKIFVLEQFLGSKGGAGGLSLIKRKRA